MNDIDIFIEGLKELNINLNDNQKRKFNEFKELIKEWNKKINITAITDDKEIYIKHFIDSLTIMNTDVIASGDRIIDVGTGGGFPGIPIKIVDDSLDITLLDSLMKRINFLGNVINKIELNNTVAIHARAEDYGKDKKYRAKYDVAVSRAVAPLNILAEYCIPFVKKDGYFIAMKGSNVESEVLDSKRAISILGAEIQEIKKFILPYSDISHSLVIIKKIKDTPTKYPRNPGKPKKNPL